MKISIASTWMPKDLSTDEILRRIHDLAYGSYGFRRINISVVPGSYYRLGLVYPGYICHISMHPIPGYYDRVSELEAAIARYKAEVTYIFAKRGNAECLDERFLDEQEE